MADQTVALEILRQLGGNRFKVMTGAESFSSGEKMLSFRLKSNPKKIKGVRITLDPSDTYTMEFLSIRNMEVKTVSKAEGIYCDMLQETFTDHTGLYTSL